MVANTKETSPAFATSAWATPMPTTVCCTRVSFDPTGTMALLNETTPLPGFGWPAVPTDAK
jgi:hypothetical protein